MQFDKEHLYPQTHWDFETTHFVMSKDGKRPTMWRAYPREDFELIGAGGEAAIFAVDVQPANSSRSLPMVLKTYSMYTQCPFPGKKPEIMTWVGLVEDEVIKELVDRQLEGYRILLEANLKLAEAGLLLINLPPTVRPTLTDLNQSAILMTDLTAGGRTIIEVKHLLEPAYGTERLASDVSSIFPSFDENQRRVLANQAISLISDEVERARYAGVDFRQDHLSNREYPHQFSSWSIILPQLNHSPLMIHDFSSVRRIGSDEDFTEMTSGLTRAREIWL